MSRISFKSLIVPAVIGAAIMFSGTAANAAPVTPAVSAMPAAGVHIVQVDHHWGYRPHYRPARNACSAVHAARKAERMGFRRTRVDVRRDTVRVYGVRKGFRSSVTFARAPGCPVIR
ncbi:antifreeze protein [Brucella sp. IR073]|uniref:antifreeze protein n=1 Tax=unclassified Brucella TaxID=2632610 RepID=UPI003B9804A9